MAPVVKATLVEAVLRAILITRLLVPGQATLPAHAPWSPKSNFHV